MVANAALLLIASLAADARTTPAQCERAVLYSLNPNSLYRTARTASVVIKDGARTEVVDDKWLGLLSARMDGLRPSGKRGLRGDIRLVAVVECKGRKAIQLAVPALCEWVEVDGTRAPFDPVLFGLLLEKVSPAHKAPWSSRAGVCKQDRKAEPGGH